MNFTLAFQGATFRVAHAEPKAGESVAMEAHHLNPDGTLVPIPYLTKGKMIAIDCLGNTHYFVSGGEENTVLPIGKFSVVATEDGDYWCTSPLPGNRIVREGRVIVPAGSSAVIEKGNIVNALFTDNALVNGTAVAKGTVVRLSVGRKTVSQPEGRELHVILFRTEAT